MKVFDIVTEVRQVGRGDYAGFVWDQPRGSSTITVTFPDGRTTNVTSQADARRVADDWLQRSRPAKPPVETDDLTRAERRQLSRTGRISRGGQTYTRAEIDSFTQQARDRRAQAGRDAAARNPNSNRPARASFATKFRAVRRVLGTAGGLVLTVALWNEIEETMAQLYEARYNEEINQAQYERAVASAFGAWVAVATPTVISVLSTATRALVVALRRANTASSLAMFAGGPLGIGLGILKFVLWEAGTWAAAYYISTSETAQRWFAKLIFSRIGASVFEVMDMGAQVVANVDNIVARAVDRRTGVDGSTDDARADREERNARRLAGGATSLDPADVASRRLGAEPAPRNQAAPATPRSAPSTTPSPAAPGNPLIAPQFR